MKTEIIAVIIATTLGTTSIFAHSRAIKPEYVDKLLQPYFGLQKSLADDNLADAKKSGTSFKEMLGHGPSFEDAPSLLDFQDQIDHIINATELSTARTAFHTLSNDLAEMIEHVGTSGVQNVYQMSCPMAFEGKGGAWMQSSKDLANPYYGAMMYSCGAVQSQLAKSKLSETPGHEDHAEKGHSEHKH